MKNRKLITIFICSVIIFISCNMNLSNDISINKESPIVATFGEVLYAEDVNKAIPSGLSGNDSLDAANLFVRKWIDEQLIYAKAKSNVSDQNQIDQLVEDYRKSLTIYTYQEKLLKENLAKEITEDELKSYYENNKSNLKLESYIIKGLFLKVPSSSVELDKLRRWYQSNKTEAKENIEKASIQNVVIYNYFYDKWTDLDDVTANIPTETSSLSQMLKARANIEIVDSTYTYLLHIEDYLATGSTMPYEYAKNQILDILINQRKNSFINKLRDDLYKKSLDDGQIKYYNK